MPGTWTSSPSTPGLNFKGQDWERNAENCQANDLMQKLSSWKSNEREHGDSTSCAIWDFPQHEASSICALGRHWLRRCPGRSVPLSLPDWAGEKSGEAREWRSELQDLPFRQLQGKEEWAPHEWGRHHRIISRAVMRSRVCPSIFFSPGTWRGYIAQPSLKLD